jgi:hypothetical protein
MSYKKRQNLLATCEKKEAISRNLKPLLCNMFWFIFFLCLEKIGERARECKGLPVGVERGRVAPLEAAVQPQLPCPSNSVKFGFYIN